MGLIYNARDLEIGRAEECEDKKDLRDEWNRKKLVGGIERKRERNEKEGGGERKKKIGKKIGNADERWLLD